MLRPDDDSDTESESSDDYGSDESNGYSSDDEVDEVVVLSSDSFDDEPDVQLLAPVLHAVEGQKNSPIDVDKLSEVADNPELVVVKQEEEGDGEDVVEPAPAKKKRAAVNNNEVRRSQRLKMLKEEE